MKRLLLCRASYDPCHKDRLSLLPDIAFHVVLPSFDVLRQDILAGIVQLFRPCVLITDLSGDALTRLLLYGDQDLSYDLNKSILELTFCFIHETGSF